MICNHLGLLLVISSLLYNEASGVCTERESPKANLFFKCSLEIEDFTFDSPLVGDGGGEPGASYTVQEVGYPGRPSWIKFLTSPDGTTVILHGTPTTLDIRTVNLTITALRSDSKISTKHLLLAVSPLQGRVDVVLDFVLTNVDIVEFLLTAMNFSDALGDVFPDRQPLITEVIDPQEINIQIPEPPQRRGVVVQVTPEINTTTRPITTTPALANSVQENCSISTPNLPSSLPLPPQHFQLFFVHGYSINWCLYTITVTEDLPIRGSSVSSETTPLTLPTVGRSYITLTVIIVIMGVVLIMALSGLSCVFCGRRKQALIVPKSRRNQNNVLLLGTKSTTSGMYEAQLKLRGLSYEVAQEGEGGPHPQDGVGLDLEEPRPQSSQTACLEYNEPQEAREYRARDLPPFNLGPPPPEYKYRYDPQLLDRTDTPPI